MTESIIVANLAIYLFGVAASFFGWVPGAEVITSIGHFDPQHFRLWQLITYQFMHDPHGIWHIAFNMLFLWVFGCAVEGRLGRLGFLGFYLIGGIVAAIAHGMVDPHPVIGASGSIAGVTGAFLALFPRSRILVLFFIFGIISVPALWFIGFYFCIDVARQMLGWLGGGGGGVAYMAHIAGYLYGFGTGFLLLATRVLKREEFDVFFLFTQARRRAAFRAASRQQAAGLWDSAQADTTKRLAEADADAQMDEQTTRIARLKSQVQRLLGAGDLPAAARAYQAVLAEAPNTRACVLAEPQQIDLASQLYADGAYADAARAYELFLDRYPATGRRDEVRLILGLIYTRQLGKPDRARSLIEQARPRLRDEQQSALADQLLAELNP